MAQGSERLRGSSAPLLLLAERLNQLYPDRKSFYLFSASGPVKPSVGPSLKVVKEGRILQGGH